MHQLMTEHASDFRRGKYGEHGADQQDVRLCRNVGQGHIQSDAALCLIERHGHVESQRRFHFIGGCVKGRI